MIDGIGGAYSHALPGEATNAQDFSTAHGAYASDVSAAEEALAALEQVR
jgi:hypothetical protein